MNKALLPHFLIVGAPKCGTTSLHFYLSQHPSINTAEKEIHFFGKDLNYKVAKPTLEHYQSFFKPSGLNGDSSVWYLYSDSILTELEELGIKPKIIIMARNPVELAYSLHSQNIVDANEDELSFEKALSLEESRTKGLNLPKGIDPVRSVFYSQAADIYARVKKFQDHFGKDNVWVGLQEDLKNNPSGLLKDLEQFLELPHFPDYDFTKQNENKSVKNKSINHLIKKAGKSQIALFRFIIPFKSIRKRIVDKLYFGNLVPSTRPALSLETKTKLENQFRENTKRLNEIIKPDIDHWIK